MTTDKAAYNEYAIDSRLPPNWKPDYSLWKLLPPSHNYRSFKRVPAAPHRYAACVLGGGVFDIQDRRFLSPIIDASTKRRRYRLDPSDHAKGQIAAIQRPYYARIIAELVYGAPPKGAMQAHHKDHTRTNDTWDNITWTSPEANRGLALRNAGKTANPKNPRNQKLTYSSLATFLRMCDHDIFDLRRAPDFDQYAKQFGVSSRQLRRIFKGETRALEVLVIQEKLKAARQNNPLFT